VATQYARRPLSKFGVGQCSYLDFRSHPCLGNAGNIGPPTTRNFQSYGTPPGSCGNRDCMPYPGIWTPTLPKITTHERTCEAVNLIAHLWAGTMGWTQSREWEIRARGSEVHFNPLFFNFSGIHPEFLQNLPFLSISRENTYVAEKDPFPEKSGMRMQPQKTILVNL
jgi:hypothetical protein